MPDDRRDDTDRAPRAGAWGGTRVARVGVVPDLRSALRLLLIVGVAAAWLTLAAARGGYFAAPRVPPPPEPLLAGDVVVLDGDTFRVRGRVVRLLGVDCPERAAPWFDGDQEPWASQASELARERIARAGRIDLLRSADPPDARGRELAHLLLDGEPLALALIEARLAWPTVDRFGHGGYPGIAAEIALRARGRRPRFQPPWRWRREHRRE